MVAVRGLCGGLLAAALAVALLAGPAGGQDAARPAPPFTLHGSGEGHSVGLSQWGARALALAGRNHVGILQHFYTDVQIAPQTATATTEPLRVGLFHANARVSDPTVLRLTALGGSDGGVDVALAAEAGPARVAAGQTWTLVHDPGVAILRPPGFALQDAGGRTVARGPGPVTVRYPTGGAPALRLPQIAGSDTPADGAVNRGVVTVTRDEASGRLDPLLALPLEEYLLGVDEMPAGWGLEALRAQAVVSRTVAAQRLAAGPRGECGCHVGLTPPDQSYAGYAREADPQAGAWREAVTSTTGQAVTAGGQLVDAVYARSHGGRSENMEESWAFGGRSLPHLRSVTDPWVSDPRLAGTNPQAAWSHELPHAVLADLVGLVTVTEVDVAARTIGGTPLALSVSGWAADGRRVVDRRFQGSTVRVAGAEVFLALRNAGAPPPSQQVGVIGFTAFPDVASSSPHAYNVAAIAERRVTTGRADGTYDPRAGVRRDQMATFIARALNLPLDPQAPDRFDDVPRGSAHRDAVNAVAAAGIAQGVAPRRYAPGATVTRDQMATFIARAFDLGESNQDRFADTRGSVHRTRINAVAARGVTAGCSPDRYCPRLAVTRDQMASFLARALGFGW